MEEGKYPVYRDISILNMNYAQSSIYADTVGVRTPESVLKGLMFSRYNRFISQEYLMNYRTDNSYIGFIDGVTKFAELDAILTSINRNLEEELDDVINLPEPGIIETEFTTAITRRRSYRTFNGCELTIQQLSDLLFHTDGITGEAEAYNIPEGVESKTMYFRAAPSGGGLYPITLYVFILRVEGLQNGIYKYYPYSHSLKPVDLMFDGDVRSLAEFGNIEIEKCAFFVMYNYNFLINSRKYGDSGLMYAAIETGEIAQNLQLACSSMNLGACDLGGYVKQRCEMACKVDGVNSHIIHFTIVGGIE